LKPRIMWGRVVV